MWWLLRIVAVAGMVYCVIEYPIVSVGIVIVIVLIRQTRKKSREENERSQIKDFMTTREMNFLSDVFKDVQNIQSDGIITLYMTFCRKAGESKAKIVIYDEDMCGALTRARIKISTLENEYAAQLVRETDEAFCRRKMESLREALFGSYKPISQEFRSDSYVNIKDFKIDRDNDCIEYEMPCFWGIFYNSRSGYSPKIMATAALEYAKTMTPPCNDKSKVSLSSDEGAALLILDWNNRR